MGSAVIINNINSNKVIRNSGKKTSLRQIQEYYNHCSWHLKAKFRSKFDNNKSNSGTK